MQMCVSVMAGISSIWYCIFIYFYPQNLNSLWRHLLVEAHQCWGERAWNLGHSEVVGARLRFGLCCEEAPRGGGEVWGGFVVCWLPWVRFWGDLLSAGRRAGRVWPSGPVRRYFTLFMNLLNDCSEAEEDGAAAGGRKRGMSRRLASLRHCTVLAMSNSAAARARSPWREMYHLSYTLRL